jgi:hypothetical protein
MSVSQHRHDKALPLTTDDPIQEPLDRMGFLFEEVSGAKPRSVRNTARNRSADFHDLQPVSIGRADLKSQCGLNRVSKSEVFGQADLTPDDQQDPHHCGRGQGSDKDGPTESGCT